LSPFDGIDLRFQAFSPLTDAAQTNPRTRRPTQDEMNEPEESLDD
jgi:hypothetical protein